MGGINKIFGLAAASSLAVVQPVVPRGAFVPTSSPAPDITGCAPYKVPGKRAIPVPGTEPVSCDASSHRVSYTAAAPEGTGVYLDCAWKPGKNGPEFDPRYSEYAVRNDKAQSAQRLQHVGDTWVATKAVDLHAGSSTITAIVQTLNNSGAVLSAGQYDIDTNSDVRSNRKPARAGVRDGKALIASGELTENRCKEYVAERAARGWIDNDYYNPVRATAFFAKQVAAVQQLKK